MELGDDVVESALADPGSAPVSDRVKAALALIERFTLHPDMLDREDLDRARRSGLTDEDIVDVFDVAAVFNIINRLADSFDFRVFEWRDFKRGAKVLQRVGYRFPRLLWPGRGR